MAAAKKAYLPDPIREAEAVRVLIENVAITDDDHELLLDTIEGQTGFMECIDALLVDMAEAYGHVEGIDAAIIRLKSRKDRFEKRIDTRRALLEQALMIAEVDASIERPVATIGLSKRPPGIEITTESEIPASYWKTGAPTLDKKALAEALKARAKALEDLPEDPAARATALASLPPEIPGAVLTNGAPSLTTRWK